MADYTTLGSFNTGGAASLNGELIQKLYDAEAKSRVTPIEESIELWDTEEAKIAEIQTKVSELLETTKQFDLWSSGNNAFEQVTATTSGESAIFDAADVGALKPGTMNIDITSLAQKDSFQSKLFNSKDTDITNVAGQKITINGEEFGISDVTLDELATTITNSGLYTASVEQVSDTQYRLVVKSNEPGEDNSLEITQTDNAHLGFINQQATSSAFVSTDLTGAGDLILNGITFNQLGTSTYADLVSAIDSHADFTASFNVNNEIEITTTRNGGQVTIDQDDLTLGLTTSDNLNHVLKAQNLQATVDGVSYDVSANSITIDGNLKITAASTGKSSISIQQDDSFIVPAIQDMATKYNELLALVTEELYSADISVKDTSSLKQLLGDIKSMMYLKFGAETPEFGAITTDTDHDDYYTNANIKNNETNLFSLGFEFDKTGLLTIDTTVLGKAVSDDIDHVKRVFIGSAENEGFGTLLKEHIDNLNSYNGLFSNYEDNMEKRKTDLEDEKEKAVKDLDTKYDTMAAQFAAYASIISQLESSFGALKQTIAAENSSN